MRNSLTETKWDWKKYFANTSVLSMGKQAHGRLRQRIPKLQASLGYIERPY